MKNLYFILFAFLLVSINLKSQLSGTAFLSGQTNHSGIKIKFTAASGTAVTDSVFTNASGNYTANITNGVYTIVISKTGYIFQNYNNGNTVLLTNTVTLNAATLLPGTQVIVSGNVSGNWTSNNIYLVNGDITIPPGSALTIHAGTVIKFNGNYSLTANGTLTAIGALNNNIVFTSNFSSPSPNDWRYIELHNSASIVEFCTIEYANCGLVFSACSPTITNNIIRNIESVGIYCNNCQPMISGNEVHNILGSQGAIGIWVENNPCCGVIECNQVYGINSGYHAYGMITGSNFVRNNVIHDITSSSELGPAIEVRGNSRVENNYLYSSVQGIEFDNTFGPATPTICNNTISRNKYGIDISMPTYVTNNVVTNNTYGIVVSSSVGVNITYNLIWNNSGGNYLGSSPTGLGQMVSTNSQGNAIDSYFNLSQDPLFLGGNGPLLNSNSPCLGSGNSTYSTNIGFFSLSNCAAAIPTGINRISHNNPSLNIYPNPANGIFHVAIETYDMNGIRLFNVSGQEMKFEKLSETDFNVSQLSNGIYFLVVATKAGCTTKKLVIAH